MKQAFGQTRVLLAAVAASALMGAAAPAMAKIQFTGTGAWDTAAQTSDPIATTPYSAPGDTFSFSFQLPNTISTTTGPSGGLDTTQVTFATYDLNGVAVSTTLGSVELFTAAESGGFDLHFDDGTTVSIYSGDVSNLKPGSFSGPITLNDGLGDQGLVSGTLTAVPEPATWAMMLMGFGAMGVAVRSARRKSAAATA